MGLTFTVELSLGFLNLVLIQVEEVDVGYGTCRAEESSA
jgi:hypothetical protein|uniref:Uncharacterized protein n=1 Tax=uncultured bacterium esnapd26 TaxID=1366607 RepID=S5UDD3_9BACT|nr:hypothetical protein [uncultured bacterium esnapd26]